MPKAIATLSGLALSLVLSVPAPAEKEPRFESPEVISAVEAVYPANAVYWGTVVLGVTIGPNGEIQGVKVLRDAPGLTPEALRAIHKWKFRAARLDGRPIRSTIPVTFSFSRPRIWWDNTIGLSASPILPSD